MLIQPKLLALSGPLRSKAFDLNEEVLSVGREAGASILIDHKSVSRRHCVFRSEGMTYRISDEGSRNGTFVNGERVEERVLCHGDRIMVGNSSFMFLTRDEDFASLLSDVRLTDEEFDSAAAVELRREDTIYLHPDGLAAGSVNDRILRNFSIL